MAGKILLVMRRRLPIVDARGQERSNVDVASERTTGGTDPAPEVRAVAQLSSRLVYSLLKAAVRVAARSRLPMAELVDLVQLAYFEEVRRHHPRELGVVADALGLSLRSVGTLNRRLKRAFFAAEQAVQPARRITSLLLDGPRSAAELERQASELEPSQVRRALDLLRQEGWVERSGRRFSLRTRLRSFVDEELSRRIDALNNQMEIIASSVWARFLDRSEGASGRTWVFAARPADIQAFIAETIRTLRHGAIDLEEAALAEGAFARYGVTVAFSPVEKEP
jgi:DNA-binding transcriptional ArsR family regulator